MTPQELIAKLETATVGSQELDLEIWKFLNPKAIEIKGIWSSGGDHFVAHHTKYSKERFEGAQRYASYNNPPRESEYTSHGELKRPTEDLTAAAALIPEGRRWQLRCERVGLYPDSNFCYTAEVFTEIDPAVGPSGVGYRCPTAALALTVAAMKARLP